LETTSLLKIVSLHKLLSRNDEPFRDVLLQDVTAINDFLFYTESEPFISPEKAENRKYVSFKKKMTA
jgi:hypothetical protein